MRKRNMIISVASVGVASAAIGGGAFVTSSAMASTTTPDNATVSVVYMASGGDKPIKCTFDDVPVSNDPTVLGVGLPGVASGSADGGAGLTTTNVGAEPGLSAAGGPTGDGKGATVGGTIVVAGTAGSAGPVTVSGSAALAGAPSGAVAIGVLPGGPDTPTLLSPDNVRPGTGEECAAVRPKAVPAPPTNP